MKAQFCPIKECGAVIYLLAAEEGELAVDPRPLQVAVPDGDRFRLTWAYRPHGSTCVDVTARRHHIPRVRA